MTKKNFEQTKSNQRDTDSIARVINKLKGIINKTRSTDDLDSNTRLKRLKEIRKNLNKFKGSGKSLDEFEHICDQIYELNTKQFKIINPATRIKCRKVIKSIPTDEKKYNTLIQSLTTKIKKRTADIIKKVEEYQSTIINNTQKQTPEPSQMKANSTKKRTIKDDKVDSKKTNIEDTLFRQLSDCINYTLQGFKKIQSEINSVSLQKIIEMEQLYSTHKSYRNTCFTPKLKELLNKSGLYDAIYNLIKAIDHDVECYIHSAINIAKKIDETKDPIPIIYNLIPPILKYIECVIKQKEEEKKSSNSADPFKIELQALLEVMQQSKNKTSKIKSR